MESTSEARKERGKEDVSDKSHDWNVHVWGIEIVARGEEVVAVGRRILGAGGG